MDPACTGWCTAGELYASVDVGDRVKFDRLLYESAKGKAVIREDTLEALAHGDMCAVDNSLDIYATPFSPTEIVQRAYSRLGEASYSLITNNCEHFASWCRNGIHYCHQVESAREMYDTVNVGDRVRISRPLDEHWAIVVAKNHEDQTVVVIHCTERQLGTRKHTKVVRMDKLEEVANGDKCAVDNSLDSLFQPLPPAEIVQRARSRIGETTNSNPSNSCEHFASWCRNGIHYSHRVSIAEAIAAGVMLIPALLTAGPIFTPVVALRLFRTLDSQ
ncbi:Group XVI phospholipase A2 [Aphelenchoides avenae]|nr:Group XVI phospholipase A2 [Aphelenchus avenae]